MLSLANKDIVNSTETDNSIGVDEIQIEKNVNHWLTRVFKLANIRTKISLILKPKPKEVFKNMKNILEKSKQMVTGWGGEIYFVYLPSYYYYETLHTDISNIFVNEEKNREIVIRTAIELDIPIIDIHKEVFEHHQDPLSLFPFRIFGHYNTEGYRLVAKAIGKRLKADGVISLSPNK